MVYHTSIGFVRANGAKAFFDYSPENYHSALASYRPVFNGRLSLLEYLRGNLSVLEWKNRGLVGETDGAEFELFVRLGLASGAQVRRFQGWARSYQAAHPTFNAVGVMVKDTNE